MTSTVPLSLGASSTVANWDAIDWQPIEANVRRLQMRIAKAVRKQCYRVRQRALVKA